MSKIFDASRMKIGERPSPTREIRRVETVSLYPAPEGQQQEEFNQLAQRTLGLRTDARGTLLHFASTTSGEGASFVSYNLAVTLAQVYGQRVVWVDANFLSPQSAIAEPARTSLGTFLQDPKLVTNITADCNPFLIPGGDNLAQARGLVAARNYGDVLDGLAARFDFVIVDLPPVLDSSETGLMALGGSGLLLVVEQKYLKWEIVEHGVEVLRNKGVHILGTVINRRDFVIPKVIYDRL